LQSLGAWLAEVPLNMPGSKARWTSVLLAACLLGCGGESIKTVPVSGQVSFPGREQPKICRLYFRPISTTGPSRPSITEAAEDGSYEVKSFKDSRGLIPGTYDISVSYFDLKPGANPDVETSWAERIYKAGEVVVDAEADEVVHNVEVPAGPARR
jgi:hypothetical protein